MLTQDEVKKAKATKLSKNFSLYELIKSASHGPLMQYPSDDVIAHLTEFAKTILQPIRDNFNIPIHINSGWRNESLNRRVGGVKNSVHKIIHDGEYIGVAADISVHSPNLSLTTIMEWAFDNTPIKTGIIYREITALNLRRPFVHLDTRISRLTPTLMEKVGPGKYILYNRG